MQIKWSVSPIKSEMIAKNQVAFYIQIKSLPKELLCKVLAKQLAIYRKL